MSLQTATSIDDLRLMAKRRVPRAFFEYCDRGSYAEETLEANRADLKALKLRQRVMVDVSNRSTATTIIGQPAALPLVLAPTGLTGMQYADGEILAARAAEKAGVPFCLSTMSICSIEDVAAGTSKPFWFQLYVMKDRGFAQSLVERAIAAKCSALVLTVDLQVQGQRHRDIKNGMTVPPRITLANLVDIATKPDWALRVLRGKRKTFGNLDGFVKGMTGVKSLGQWISGQFDTTLNWNDVAWIRSLWPGKLIIKGVLDVGDAKAAAATGADAIVVSNHGGRQLDGAPSSISALPRIVDAVGGETEILFDGGIRSGQDVLRALALGARACMVGRAFLYGLGAGGEAGVAKTIDIIAKELSVSMALTGRRTIAEIDETVIDRG
ncbi:alpha-hydroxy acid oxidase [Kaistia geumhonensis]|uniref:L-lactate dehydrogenase (Cytochrome) n=1 Tax=Kaistia geumhonensis TaxID=410839 RepID=A0ABU0M4B7_9HYPH|nr:alpha-hydroxy acid oxidase [Kaistia geumhonensis]MCX5478980.1 alpha-hydroxy acid oxidase [Kaistia geumhonensis]MDQ0515801.1 L-lactate dehydrogenase (cytochrome) [Kaistia geumhonensis]